MESRYGIGINNRYALFLDEEGEENEDALLSKAKAASAAKDKAAKEAAAAAAAAASAKPEGGAKPVSAAPQDSKRGGGGRDGGQQQGRRVQDKNDRNREGEEMGCRSNRAGFGGQKVVFLALNPSSLGFPSFPLSVSPCDHVLFERDAA